MCFYSRLVRLKHGIFLLLISSLLSFYSRLVRLKLNTDIIILYIYACFYSRLVRLKRDLRVESHEVQNVVSIPDWCD